MRPEAKNVALSRVRLSDETYRITTGSTLEELSLSIQRIGLMAPPVLVQKDSEFTIVCGFRRIAACCHLEYSHVRASVLGSRTTARECIEYAIADNALQRPLNLVEKSRSYAMLSGCYPDDSSLLAAAPSLGLNDDPAFIKKIIHLCQYPKTIQDGILSGAISLNVALELGELDPETGVAFATLFSDIRPSLNKQREMITLVEEIALREAVSTLDILTENGFRTILDNGDIDRTQKIRDVRSYLKRRRFPVLTDAEEAFQMQLKQLKLGKGLRLIPPANFEGSDYIIRLYFRNLEELKKRRAALDEAIQDPKLKAIID